ncbi:MAG: hypothetical protein ACOYVF_14745 [Candidatus Zixiibacteriota bacterium]
MVKNYPDEKQFKRLLVGTTADIAYHENKKLKRWLVTWSKA